METGKFTSSHTCTLTPTHARARAHKSESTEMTMMMLMMVGFFLLSHIENTQIEHSKCNGNKHRMPTGHQGKRWTEKEVIRHSTSEKRTSGERERESERARGGRRCSQSKGLPHSQSYDTLNALVARAIRVCTRINDTRFNIGRLSGTLCTLFGADGQLRRQRKHENL